MKTDQTDGQKHSQLDSLKDTHKQTYRLGKTDRQTDSLIETRQPDRYVGRFSGSRAGVQTNRAVIAQ